MIFTKDEEFTPQEKEEIEIVEWVPLKEAISKAGFKNLVEILEKAFPKYNHK